MKLFEIDSWYRENKLEDSWWVAVGNDVQGPVTLAQAGAISRRNSSASASVLHVAYASQNPPPWIPVEVEQESGGEQANKTTMRMQISKFKTGIVKKPISNFKGKSACLATETTS